MVIVEFSDHQITFLHPKIACQQHCGFWDVHQQWHWHKLPHDAAHIPLATHLGLLCQMTTHSGPQKPMPHGGIEPRDASSGEACEQVREKRVITNRWKRLPHRVGAHTLILQYHRVCRKQLLQTFATKSCHAITGAVQCTALIYAPHQRKQFLIPHDVILSQRTPFI